MMYKNIEAFLKDCSQTAKREVTKVDVTKYGIKPATPLGEYGEAQKFELLQTIKLKEGHRWYDKEKLTQADPSKITKYADHQRFLILSYFSDSFKKYIEDIRKHHDIPPEGFKKRSSELHVWCEKMKKEVDRTKKSFWTIDMYDFSTTKRVHLMTNEDKKDYLKNAFDCIANYSNSDSRKTEIQNKCEGELFQISPSLEFVGPLPFLWAVDWIYRKYKLLNFWFYYLMKFIIIGESLSSNALTRPYLFLKHKGSFALSIDIHSWVSKKDLLKFIEKEYPNIKSELIRMFGTPKMVKNLYRDFLIYRLRAQKIPSEEIGRIMKEEHGYKTMTGGIVRKILDRTDKTKRQIEEDIMRPK